MDVFLGQYLYIKKSTALKTKNIKHLKLNDKSTSNIVTLNSAGCTFAM